MADANIPINVHVGVVHLCPPIGSGLMPCCGRTPFEVLRWDRITTQESLATCKAYERGHAAGFKEASELCDTATTGFIRGLQAAREAVAAAKAVDVAAGHVLDESRHFVWMHDALAAIDALRGES